MTEDLYESNIYLSKLLYFVQNHAQTNQIVINYKEHLCKVQRKDYFPDSDGVLFLDNQTKWVENSFSVAELREILEKYPERVKNVLFQTYDGSYQPMVNVYESCDAAGVVYYTNILVGNPDDYIGTEYHPYRINNTNIPTIL